MEGRSLPLYRSLNSLHTRKNPLAFLPIYLEITNQIKKVEPQAVFFSIKDKTIVAVIGEKVCTLAIGSAGFFYLFAADQHGYTQTDI